MVLATFAWYVIILGAVFSLAGAFMTATLARIPLGLIVGALGAVLGLAGGLLGYLDSGSLKVLQLALGGLLAVTGAGLVAHWWRRARMTREQRMEMELMQRFRERIR